VTGRPGPGDGLLRSDRRTVVSDATALILEMIRDDRLSPGERLPSERALSDSLEVSRATVREAIRSLTAMSILEVRHGAGTFVAALDLDELLRPARLALGLTEQTLDDLFEVRLLLEPQAAGLTAKRATEEERRAIEACVEEAAAVDRDDTTEFLRLDADLHRLISRASHNPLLDNLLTSISALGYESRAATIRLPNMVDRSRMEHGRIADAILARRPELAEAAMRAHVERVRDDARDVQHEVRPI